jgi:polysaccharide pyruvyl transferase WcaK-like protein
VTIIISGAGFRSKGAEAMLRTVQTALAGRLEGARFSLWRCPPAEARLAADAGLVPLSWPGDRHDMPTRALGKLGVGLPPWAVRELLRGDRAALVRRRPGVSDALSLASRRYLERTCDSIEAVIDVSGFAYGDAWSAARMGWNRPLLAYCVTHGVPMLYLPQAWGSFTQPDIREAARRMLAAPGTAFFSRDPQSSRYLEELLGRSAGSIASHPDIAFGFRGGTPEQGAQVLRTMGCGLERPIVGIAPNMQVYRRTAGEGAANVYVQQLRQLVAHCLQRGEVDVVLQASETEVAGAALDDRYLCGVIAASVNRPDRCYLASERLTAGQTAALVSRFDYLVGSRFHSLVLGLSQGVPSMAIGWSHKYHGLLSLFDLEYAVHEAQRLDADALVATFERGWAERQAAARRIRDTAALLRTEVEELFDQIATTIVRSRAL